MLHKRQKASLPIPATRLNKKGNRIDALLYGVKRERERESLGYIAPKRHVMAQKQQVISIISPFGNPRLAL
jgi:hypothetical protein